MSVCAPLRHSNLQELMERSHGSLNIPWPSDTIINDQIAATCRYMALVHVDQIMHMCTHMCIQRQTHMHVSTHSPACTHTTINTSTNAYTPRACLFGENSLNLLRNKHKFKNPGVSNFWFGSTDYK